MGVVKQCALCKEIKELELSHIIPKFVVRHLKKTSYGNIRSAQNPNRVVQDSEKHYLLCSDCEDLFSTYETKFANTFFHPYQKGEKIEFEYDRDLYYFLTSVSWRSLYLDILDFVGHASEIGVDLDTLDILIGREKNMRDYLLGKSNTVEGIEHHIFFFGDISEIANDTLGLKELSPHGTIQRGLSSYTIFNTQAKSQATMTNIMGIILCNVYSRSEGEVWSNTEVINGKGLIKAQNQGMSGICGSEISCLLRKAEESKERLSEKQHDKIVEKFTENPEEFLNSITGKNMFKDFQLRNGGDSN